MCDQADAASVNVNTNEERLDVAYHKDEPQAVRGPTEQELREAELQKKIAAENQQKRMVSDKFENLAAAIYCELCAKGFGDDVPNFTCDKAYDKAVEAAKRFIERTYNATMKPPGDKPAPPQPIKE